jgi:hypothetical protein
VRKVVPEIVEGNIVNQSPFFFVGLRFKRAKPVMNASLGKSRGALGILILGLLYFRCEFLAVIWAFIPMSAALCPLHSPQKVCSVTSFLLRDALLPELNRRLQRKRSVHPAFSYGEHGNLS